MLTLMPSVCWLPVFLVLVLELLHSLAVPALWLGTECLPVLETSQ